MIASGVEAGMVQSLTVKRGVLVSGDIRGHFCKGFEWDSRDLLLCAYIYSHMFIFALCSISLDVKSSWKTSLVSMCNAERIEKCLSK